MVTNSTVKLIVSTNNDIVILIIQSWDLIMQFYLLIFLIYFFLSSHIFLLYFSVRWPGQKLFPSIRAAPTRPGPNLVSHTASPATRSLFVLIYNPHTEEVSKCSAWERAYSSGSLDCHNRKDHLTSNCQSFRYCFAIFSHAWNMQGSTWVRFDMYSNLPFCQWICLEFSLWAQLPV